MQVKFKEQTQRNVIFYKSGIYPIIERDTEGYCLVMNEIGCRAWIHEKFLEPVEKDEAAS